MIWVAVASAAVPFPEDGDWQPLLRGGAEVADVAGDVALDDLAGGLRWFADADAVHVRVGVAGDVETLAVLLDVDADPADFEHALFVTGPGRVLAGGTNLAATPGVHVDPLAPMAVTGSEAGGETRAVGGFVDLQVPRATLLGLGVFEATPIRFAAVSAADWADGAVDVAGCDATLGPCADLASVSADAVLVDLDGDALTAPEEALRGTDPADADVDDDGVPDGLDVDPFLCDSDWDGLPDGLEVGAVAGAFTDLAAGCFVADTDLATSTDPALADTDGGGSPDGAEDADHDGLLDPFEGDPTDPADDPDADGDGVPDLFDDVYGAGADADSDGDGLDDATEGVADPDGDGVPAFGDLDSDDDGAGDLEEGAGDTDQDGIPDRLDDDSDGDGVPDLVEGATDTDGDTVPDRLDDDSDGDGVPDALEGTADTDGDSVPDRFDDDSDGDGIGDLDEGGGDPDGDGVPSFRDDDSDGDGHLDADEGADDPDEDDEPSFHDLDADGDGRPDADEGEGDEDCDDRPDWLDGDDEDSFCDTAHEPIVDQEGNPPPRVDRGEADPFASPGQLTGGSCSTAPASASLVLVLLALLAARPARAQEVNAERFVPSVDGGRLVKVEDAAVAPRGAAGLALMLDHADDPFVYRPDEGDPVPILDAVTTARLLGWASLGGLRIGADLPVHPYTAGYGVDRPLQMGDVRLSTKVGLHDPAPLGAALFADVSLPTGNPDAWVGAGSLVARAGAIGTVESGPWLVSATAGARNGTGSELQDLVVGPAVLWGVGASAEVSDSFSASLEADGEVWLGNAGLSGALPAEGLFALRQGVEGVGAIVVGAGTGLSRGVGSPVFRLVAGFSYEPGRP